MGMTLSQLFDTGNPFIIKGSYNSEIHIYPGYDSTYAENIHRGITIQSAVYFHEPNQAVGTFPFYSFRGYACVDFIDMPISKPGWHGVVHINMDDEPEQTSCDCKKNECRICVPTFL